MQKLYLKTASLLAVLFVLFSAFSLLVSAQEGGRPKGGGFERRVGEESDERRRSESGADEQRVTKAEEIGRDRDLNTKSNEGFSDTKKLKSEIEDQRAKGESSKGGDGKENKEAWKDAQSQHAWKSHEQEFRNAGVENESQLKQHIEDVRNNPDMSAQMPDNRRVFGKLDNGKKGTIVIDNPDAKNGGTAFRNDNVAQRFEEYKRRK